MPCLALHDHAKIQVPGGGLPRLPDQPQYAVLGRWHRSHRLRRCSFLVLRLRDCHNLQNFIAFHAALAGHYCVARTAGFVDLGVLFALHVLIGDLVPA